MDNLTRLYEIFKNSSGVSTDTRENLEGKVFFALKGPNFNGNRYAKEALKRGAICAVVDEGSEEQVREFFLVGNVLETLQDLAIHHRKQLDTVVIGITGSNGKTTSKELVHLVLSQRYLTYATKGNLNNHIGVPKSLLEIQSDHEFAIIEMGANKKGDIKELCEIALPDHGFITNIGLAHLEGFGSKEGIANEKGELFKQVMEEEGKIFVNTGEKDLLAMAGDYKNQVRIGEEDGDKYTFKCKSVVPKVTFQFQDFTIDSNLYGGHNYENLKMAAGIGLEFGVNIDEISKAISSYFPTNNRSQVKVVNGVSFFLDAYNANPSSMKVSISSFAAFASNNKILILGDMLELGSEKNIYHSEVLEYLTQYDWKRIFLIGQHFSKHEKDFTNLKFYATIQDAESEIKRSLSPGDHVLLKGSRGLKLEQLSLLRQQK